MGVGGIFVSPHWGTPGMLGVALLTGQNSHLEGRNRVAGMVKKGQGMMATGAWVGQVPPHPSLPLTAALLHHSRSVWSGRESKEGKSIQGFALGK